MNALVAACNQKSSREPVVNLEEFKVQSAVNGLKNKGLALRLVAAYGRVPKYEHALATRWQFDTPELSVLCVLLLRGDQTLGEIKSRTGRMHVFNTLQEVEKALKNLMIHDDGPFVQQMPRDTGRKENRYRHNFAGDHSNTADPRGVESTQAPVAVDGRQVSSESDRLRRLEEKVDALNREVAELKKHIL
jgi:uncharacterized protein YceH (UPF0502 family)